MIEALEQRLLMVGDWRTTPVYAQPLSVASVQDTAAYDLIGSTQQRQDYGLTGKGYSVAVLDTGLDYNNPTFAGRYLGGYDFVNNDADPMDDNGHGTAVSGIIGSSNSVYPGIATGVSIITLKVLDANGQGTFGNVDLALQWVVQHQRQFNIVAVNMSFGSGNYQSNPLTVLDADLEALRTEGVFVAAAAGNDFFGSNSQPGLAFPAVDPLVVSVGATWAKDYGPANWVNGAKDFKTESDKIASFSQRSSELDLLAPGAYVTAPYLSNSIVSLAGTSMSTPMVTGSAVLVRQALEKDQHPADPVIVLHVLQNTGVSVVDANLGQDNVQHTGLTFKRINVESAVASILPHYTPNQAFVVHLYQDLLDRKPEQNGLDYWSELLDKGQSRDLTVLAVWNSSEHFADEVQADYQTILHRKAGVDEIAAWVHLMQAGWNNDRVMQFFYESQEYFKLMS